MERGGLKSAELIIIDDDQMILKILKRVLEENGYSVLIFNNPEIALTKLKESGVCPKLIIIDYYMPNMTGLEFYQEIKKYFKDIKCIFMSGNIPSDITISNCIDFISKPFNLYRLLSLIKEKLNR